MAISMVRPGVARITYSNGAFWFEYDMERRVLLGKNRGNSERVDLAQVEREAAQQAKTAIDGTATPTR